MSQKFANKILTNAINLQAVNQRGTSFATWSLLKLNWISLKAIKRVRRPYKPQQMFPLQTECFPQTFLLIIRYLPHWPFCHIILLNIRPIFCSRKLSVYENVFGQGSSNGDKIWSLCYDYFCSMQIFEWTMLLDNNLMI